MQKRMTISIDAQVYDGLVATVGRGRISAFLQELARPHVVRDSLEDDYRAMACDSTREAEALEWAEGLLSDAADAPR